jgi:hypothetical protein
VTHWQRLSTWIMRECKTVRRKFERNWVRSFLSVTVLLTMDSEHSTSRSRILESAFWHANHFERRIYFHFRFALTLVVNFSGFNKPAQEIFWTCLLNLSLKKSWLSNFECIIITAQRLRMDNRFCICRMIQILLLCDVRLIVQRRSAL